MLNILSSLLPKFISKVHETISAQDLRIPLWENHINHVFIALGLYLAKSLGSRKLMLTYCKNLFIKGLIA